MLVMLVIALQYGVLSGDSGFTLTNFTDVLGDPLYRDVALTTFQIATIAMLIQLAIAIPLAYVLAYKAGRFELGAAALPRPRRRAQPDGPDLRLADAARPRGPDQRGPACEIGLIDAPIDALLFSKFAVIVVLSTSYLTYTVIPIYAAMKAIDRNLFEAARDLGAGWLTTTRRVLLPLIAPGIFVALLLVYIPLFTDFASPALVGGTEGYMLGNVGQRPRARERRPERRRRDEHADARRLGDVRDRRLPPDEDQAAGVMSAAGSQTWDVAIVGGGHNGLVAAYYLASAGPARRSCCERREIVGGCCVTEEFAPGFRASTGAYVLSMLREPVWRDLRLVERGITVDPAARRSTCSPTAPRSSSTTTWPRRRREFATLLGGRRPRAARVRGRAGRDRRADHAADRHDAARTRATCARASSRRLARLGGHGGAPPRR